MKISNDITSKQAVWRVQRLITAYNVLGETFKNLSHSVGNIPGTPLYNAAYETFDVAVSYLSELLGDNNGMISEYIFDYECGQKTMKILTEGAGREFYVNTIEDLVEHGLGIERED